MEGKKILGLRPPSEADAKPAIRKKGRGWEISSSRLDALHDRAREMRRHSSPAHKALAERFAKADFGRYSFTRHAVIGSAIVDFGFPNLGLAIMIDEDEGADGSLSPALATRRDKSLETVGMRVMRISAAEILSDMDAVLASIAQAMRARIEEKQAARRDHRRNSTPRTASRPRNNRTNNADNR